VASTTVGTNSATVGTNSATEVRVSAETAMQHTVISDPLGKLTSSCENRTPGRTWLSVEEQVALGSDEWLGVAEALAPGTDAGTSHGLNIALHHALAKNPERVLTILARLPERTELVCNDGGDGAGTSKVIECAASDLPVIIGIVVTVCLREAEDLAMEQTATVRVSKSTVIIFAIIFLPLLLWGTSLLWSTGQTEKGVLIGIGYVFMVYWVCSPSIELIPGGIIYRALFRRREIDLSTVSEVSVSANPAPSLVQTAKRGGDLFRFTIKPFSKAGLVAVLHHIRQSNPSYASTNSLKT
jgi:hypothetical protein